MVCELEVSMVHDWEHIVSLFNTKFFCAEVKFTLVVLGRMRQYSGEDLDAYVKCFMRKHQIAMIQWLEDVLVDICLYSTIEDYWIYLENRSFIYFSGLIDATR